MIAYCDNLDFIRPEDCDGFFVGWPNPPKKETFYKLLQQSSYRWIAMDDGKLVGFITAISDGVLAAYIPLVEVLPAYQNSGIGGELVRRMLETLNGYYMVDLLCDKGLIPFYEKQGMYPATGALMRNFERQSGTE